MPLNRLLAFAMLTACTSQPAIDAGRDAGADAGHDAGRDSGRDARPLDAGPDAGWDAGPFDGGPDDPGWVRLPGLPDECPITRATYPERLWDMDWVPCADGAGDVVAGCQFHRGVLTGIVDAWHDDAGTWIKVLVIDRVIPGRIVGLAPVDGPLIAAWHEPGVVIDDDIFCRVTALAVGGNRAAFTAQYSNFADPSLSRIWLYVAPPETIGVAEEPEHVFPSGFTAGNRSIDRMWINDDMLAIQPSPDGTLYTRRADVWDTLTGIGTVTGIPQNSALVADHILWEAWRGFDDVRLVHARWGEASRVWRDVTPGDTKGFGTDGIDVAWQELHDRQPDGSYDRVELWTAPYRRDLENIEPRFVRLLDQRANSPGIGGGWVANRRLDPQRVEVFSLRDGSRRTFIPPTGFVTINPYYASEREIMFAGAGADAIRFDPTLLPIDVEP